MANGRRPGKSAQRLHSRADCEPCGEELPVRIYGCVKTTVAGEPHERIAGDGRGQKEEAKKVATTHDLFEQSTFETHRETP